jgi:hypothetical protein
MSILVSSNETRRLEMNRLGLQSKKIDVERVMFAVGMTLMETVGAVFLICGVFNIRIF